MPYSKNMQLLDTIITKVKAPRCGSSSYPVLSMTMHNGIVPQNERFKKGIASIDTSDYKVVHSGQLVVGFPIDEGVIYVQNLGYSGIMSPAYNIWDIDTNRVNPSYLELALHSPQSMFYYINKMHGSTARRRSITDDNLLALEIPLPPIHRQKEIVGSIHSVDKTIVNYKNYLSKLDLIVKSRFIELFDKGANDSCTLSDLAEFITVGIANAATHAYSEKGVVMLRNLNIRENLLDDKDLVYIKPEFAAKYTKKALRTGDILVTRTGYPGIACVVPKEYEGCQTFTTLIVRLKKDCGITPIFACHYINSPIGKKYVETMKAGSSQQNFGATSLKKMPFIVPPHDLQHSFSAFVQQVDKSKFAIQKAIDKLELLKASLMQEYFG